MSVKLATELEEHGCDLDPNMFEDMLQDLRAAMCPCLTSEQMLYRPSEVMLPFIKAVRLRCGVELPEELVCRRLSNIRKAGQE